MYDYEQEIHSLIIGPHTYGDTPWKQKEMIIADAEQLLQVVLPVVELPQFCFQKHTRDCDCYIHDKFFLGKH